MKHSVQPNAISLHRSVPVCTASVWFPTVSNKQGVTKNLLKKYLSYNTPHTPKKRKLQQTKLIHTFMPCKYFKHIDRMCVCRVCILFTLLIHTFAHHSVTGEPYICKFMNIKVSVKQKCSRALKHSKSNIINDACVWWLWTDRDAEVVNIEHLWIHSQNRKGFERIIK